MLTPLEDQAVHADPGVIADHNRRVGLGSRLRVARFGRPMGVEIRIHNHAIGGQQHLTAEHNVLRARSNGRAAQLRALADEDRRCGAEGCADASGAANGGGRARRQEEIRLRLRRC